MRSHLVALLTVALAIAPAANATCFRTSEQQSGPPPGCTTAKYTVQTYTNPANSGLVQDIAIYSFLLVEDAPPSSHQQGPDYVTTVTLQPGDSVYLYAADGTLHQYSFWNGMWQVQYAFTGKVYTEMYVVASQAAVGPKTEVIDFSMSPTTYTYSGSTITPNVTPSKSGATFDVTGNKSGTDVGMYRLTATGNGAYSGTKAFDWEITKAPQTASISPTSATISAGQSVSFSASGTGWGSYQWMGATSTGATTASQTFSTPGTYSVSVMRVGSSNYDASPSATATVTVLPVHVHSWQAYDNAGAWQTGVWSAWSPAWDVNTHYTDESQTQNRSRQDRRWHDRGQRCTSGDADVDLGTDGWEYNNVNDSQTLTGTQSRPLGNQSAVWITPGFSSITTGAAVAFNAGGGDGTGAYSWGGQASGAGSSKTIRFSVAGTYYVTVYRAASSGWNQSVTATAYIDVNDAASPQGPLAISPANATVVIGTPVTFTASGGNGTGEYRWGNSATGTGTSKTLTFAAVGTYFVAVSRDASTGWLAAPSIFVSVTVVPPSPLNLHLATRAVPKRGMERWVQPSPTKTWTGSVQPVTQ